jgi:hypothetical protein
LYESAAAVDIVRCELRWCDEREREVGAASFDGEACESWERMRARRWVASVALRAPSWTKRKEGRREREGSTNASTGRRPAICFLGREGANRQRRQFRANVDDGRRRDRLKVNSKEEEVKHRLFFSCTPASRYEPYRNRKPAPLLSNELVTSLPSLDEVLERAERLSSRRLESSGDLVARDNRSDARRSTWRRTEV